jgi:N-acetylneuraminic acid mutarotase
MKSNLGFVEPNTVESRRTPNHFTRKWLACLKRFAGVTGTAIALLAFGVAQAASSGPASGGNTLTISGTRLGNGSDITNVTICGVVALIQSQTVNSVTVMTGRADDGGTGDIRAYSVSRGLTTFTNGYTYNPPGSIFGLFMGWLSVSNLPAGCSQLAAASVNGKVYAIGGYNYTNFQNTACVYDPSQPTLGWLSVSNLPAKREGLAATSAGGKIYAIGGTDNGISFYSTVYVYDPSQPTLGWLSVSNLPAKRFDLAAASMNGKIYAIGGYDGTNYQSTVFVYDPSQPTVGWLSMSNLPVTCSGLAAASANGKIYSVGGYGSTSPYTYSTVYVYDPSRPTLGWLSVSNLPTAYGDLAATSVSGNIYVIGGENDTYPYYYSTFFAYAPFQPTRGWSSFSNLPTVNAELAAASANGKVYAIGGYDNYTYQSTVYAGSFATGVVPSSGSTNGGNTVTISGNYLGNGDVTSVTLCGIPATIMADNSPTQVIVSAGAAAIAVNGNVVVNSTTYGGTVKSNAYTYFYLPPAAPNASAATNVTVNSFYANWSGVTGVTNYLLDVSTTNNFTFYVAGYTNLSVGNVTTFQVSGLNPATMYYYRARCQQNGLVSDNSSTISVQTLNLNGGMSVSNGPASGGNTLTIAGTGLGNGSDITNVTICGVAAVIQSQAANSVTVVLGTGGSGTGDILVYSASRGVTTFVNSYTYNPPGSISGPFMCWLSMSNLPVSLEYLATATANGKIYAIGGANAGSYSQSSVYVYDTAQPSLSWLSTSSLPVVRVTLAAVSVNSKIYAIGGDAQFNSPQSTVYVYDTAQASLGWLSVSGLPAASEGLAAASVNGKIYVIGGYNIYTGYQSTVYVYDPAQPTLGWLSVSNLPVGRKYSAAASMNGKIYTIGGSDLFNDYSTVYVYDTTQPTLGWLSVSNLPSTLSSLAAVSMNGNIYAIGGRNGGNSQSTVYAYDPSQPTLGWLSVSNLPAGRDSLAAASVNGKIYAIGGYNMNTSPYFCSTVYEGSFATGVVPSSGPLVGGNTVTISGYNLGNGDVTSVTLCGIPATILADNSPSQVVVSAGAAMIPTTGDVVVNSTSYGVTVKGNGYSYLPPTITTIIAFDGTHLQLSWPTNCLGWELQAQTNPAGVGIGTNWFPMANSTNNTQMSIPIDPNNPCVFYRLHQH